MQKLISVVALALLAHNPVVGDDNLDEDMADYDGGGTVPYTTLSA